MSDDNKVQAAISKKNILLIEQFKEYLVRTGLSESTINNHIGNIEFFSEYLTYYDPPTILTNADSSDINGFLGDWFVRKAMWSSPSSVRSNISTFKKLFKWFVIEGQYSNENYKDILDTIKTEKDCWLENSEIDEDFY
jgi:site-specific recombinase XerD